MRPLNACTRRVPRPELFRLLLAAGRLQRLVLLAGQQPDDPWLLLRPRALRPRRARRAIRPREPGLEGTPTLYFQGDHACHAARLSSLSAVACISSSVAPG